MPSLLFTIPTGTDRRTRNRAANIGGLKFSCLFERAEIQIPANKYECPQRLSFSPGNLEVHSPITTPELICVMASTLQPIRGCPLHSGETGTRLSSAIHRRLFSRFFLREGGRLYTGYRKYSYFNRKTLFENQNSKKSDVAKYLRTKNGSTKNAAIKDLNCGNFLIKNTEIL